MVYGTSTVTTTQGPVETCPTKPVVSCLCVTEERRPFLPWLLWNYQKQDYVDRELIIVDSSPHPVTPPDATVTVVACPPGTNVGRKRNLAVEAARGTLVTWFDDDDWQHPRKLSILAGALGEAGVLAGSKRSWFIDIGRSRARPHDAQREVLFNGLGARRSALGGVRFDEHRVRAADTAWVGAVRRASRGDDRVVPRLLSCWLCHGANLSNPVTRYVFPHPLADVCREVGAADWGDTEEKLAQLRDRLS